MKKIMILDLKQKVSETEIIKILNEYKDKEIEYIALTPYSVYFYEKLTVKYKTFHSFISVFEFSNKVVEHILELKDKLPIYYNLIMIDLIKYISFSEYKKTLNEIIKNYSIKNDVVYISDTLNKQFNGSNNTSFIESNLVYKIDISNISYNISSMNIPKYIDIKKIKQKILKYLLKIDVNYDWNNFIYEIYNLKKIKIDIIEDICIEKLSRNDLLEIILPYLDDFYIKKISKSIDKLYANISRLNYPLFSTWENKLERLIFLYKNYSIFYQHGNYFYSNMIFQYSEIEPANINFVFNDYTKNLFENLGAKKVYSVGSILFNKKIKERKKEYDFLYIIQGHDYMGNLQYVDFQNSLHSFDGYKLYQRHKAIIKLFGEKFIDKKIIIRVHPLILGNGLYVPFWELAKPYENIIIDIDIPIHNLIEKSKYIISDYFTSEFINREIHYKRDIILFKGFPTPLPKDTIEDMKKMFILVDTVDDLENKVNNIESIAKNRKRYDAIIEYYSSKKCDTKKLVNEILKKELMNERT